jgi:hypothetical protein
VWGQLSRFNASEICLGHHKNNNIMSLAMTYRLEVLARFGALVRMELNLYAAHTQRIRLVKPQRPLTLFHDAMVLFDYEC